MAMQRKDGPGEVDRAIQEAVQAVRRRRPAACLVAGGDDYLRNRASRALGEALLPESERTPFNFRVLDGEQEDVPAIVTSLCTYSLFDGPMVLWVERTRLLVSRFNVDEVLAKAAALWGDATGRGDERARSRAAHDVLRVLAVRRQGLEAIDPQGDPTPELLEAASSAGKGTGWLEQVHAYCLEHGLKPEGGGSDEELVRALEAGWPEGNTLVLVAAACDRRLRLFKALRTHGLILDVSSGSGPRWAAEGAARKRLEEMAREERSRLTPAARSLLEKKVGFDLSRLHSEVIKLATFVGPGETIDEAAVEQVVGWTQEEGQWELSNAIQERDLGRALRALHRMLQHGAAPIRLFFQVASKARDLLHGFACIDGPLSGVWRRGMDEREYRQRVRPRVEALLADPEGGGPETALLRSHPWALFQTLRATERYRREELLRAVEEIYTTNWRLVSGQGPAPALLERLVVRLVSRSSGSSGSTITGHSGRMELDAVE